MGSGHEFFAVVHPGFEATALRELAGLGIAAPRIAGSGGVDFCGKLEDAWRVNLGAGTVSRVLMRLCEFKATGFGEFRAKLAAIPWELHLADGARVAFSIHAGRSRLWHEGKLEEEAARADRRNAWPSMAAGFQFGDRAEGAPAGRQTVFLRLDENRCQASLDTSGELLYRRGHGKFVEQAPLRETLACSILRAAALERYRVVIDPFCGSGTFALEAGAIFSGRPVNLDRAFAFQEWPSFKPARFQHLKGRAGAGVQREGSRGRPQDLLLGHRRQGGRHRRRTTWNTPVSLHLVEIDQADFFHLHPPACDPADVLLVMNPPYGERQGAGGDIASFYRRIGDKVRRDYAGCGYAIIVPGLELEKALGLPHEQKILFRNGGISVALLIQHSVRT